MKIVDGEQVYEDWVEEFAATYADEHRNSAYRPLLWRFGWKLLAAIGSNTETGTESNLHVTIRQHAGGSDQ